MPMLGATSSDWLRQALDDKVVRVPSLNGTGVQASDLADFSDGCHPCRNVNRVFDSQRLERFELVV
jgi:hypothetical protein